MVTVAITGHRPNRLTKPSIIAAAFHQAFKELKATKVLQGCADGADMIAAMTAWNLHIPYVAVRPWAGHKIDDQENYNKMLRNSEKIVDLYPANNYPGPHVYHERNRHLVDNAQTLICVFDNLPRGGTWETIKYAQSKGWSFNNGIYWIDAMTGNRRA